MSTLPVGLDADAVMAAALEMLDTDGLDAFTMRALGARLGVKGPTIYWHVGSKEQLLAAVVERVVANTVEPAPPGTRWEQRLRRFFGLVRESLAAHPGVMELIRSVHSSVFESWMAEALAIMHSAGFGDDDAVVFAHTALVHGVGAAQAEANVRTAGYMETVRGEGGGRRYRVKTDVLREGLPPHLALAASYDPDQQHEIMTDIFVDGLRAQLARRRRQPD